MRFLRTRTLQLFVDSFIVLLGVILAYTLRFEGHIPREYMKQLLLVLPYVVILRIGFFALFGVYRLVWRYISLRDLPRILAASIASTAMIVFARYFIGPFFNILGITLNPLFSTVPYGVIAAELMLTTAGIISARVLWRLITERAKLKEVKSEVALQQIPKKRAILLGAGSAGVMVAREVRTRPDVGFEVIGFLDDDPRKQGSIILGFKVLGGTDRIKEFAATLEADLAIITMANVPASSIRRIVELAEAALLKVQIIPGLYEILSGRVNISKIRDVAIEDLLGRAAIHLEEDAISEFLTGKAVLVTGAGGSIGSEICRQVCRFRPRRLILLDQAENPLFHIHRELSRTFVDIPLETVIGNVVDKERMRQVMRVARPEVVFHAAAHKHVPLMELNPGEAIRNNILGSRNMADLAHELDALSFVMISTDKAVNPTSVMGATKRVAEMYVQAISAASRTRFITVRFGNVLGSEGSVVPVFKEQIARGGPVTVTHPEMKRYFMTIPEASQLVLQSAAMGRGGEIFVLEMGELISILNLARDLIRLSGYRPELEIKIEFTGVRPGEKLYEEIALTEENAEKTRHPRIWIGKSTSGELSQVQAAVQNLASLIERPDPAAIRAALTSIIPEYSPTVLPDPSREESPQLQRMTTASGRLVAVASSSEATATPSV